MEDKLKKLLSDNNVIANTIANQNNIELSKVEHALDQPINKWSVGFLNMVANALYMRAGTVLSILGYETPKVNIDDSKQEIQGVHIEDTDMYHNVRFSVVNNVLEGWHPTKQEVESLVYKSEDPKFEEDYKRLFGDNNG